MRSLHVRSLIAAAFLVAGLSAAARADLVAGSTKTWDNSGEFSLVNVTGNSRAQTTSVKDTFHYKWTHALLELIGGGLGSSSGNQVTAEQYNASEKVSFPISGDDGKNFVFELFKWDKNRFAGFENRWDGSGGIGRQLMNFANDKLVGELGGGYINEERIDSPRNDFVSGRAYLKYTHALSATSQFNQDAEYIHNWSNPKDYRLNMETSLVASLSTHLSLKASYKWNRVGQPPAGIGKDDTLTSMALVVNY